MGKNLTVEIQVLNNNVINVNNNRAQLFIYHAEPINQSPITDSTVIHYQQQKAYVSAKQTNKTWKRIAESFDLI
jgi:hypothetical protein